MSSQQFVPLQTVHNRIKASYQGGTLITTLAEIILPMVIEEGKFQTEKEGAGQLVLAQNGIQTLARDRLGFGGMHKIFSDPQVSSETKLALLKEKAGPKLSEEVYLKTRVNVDAQGNIVGPGIIDAILSSEYSQIDNLHVTEALLALVDQGVLPSDLEAESFYTHNRYMQMRLISKGAWTRDFDNEPYYGAIVVENGELGNVAFSSEFAVQRLACTNYQIGEKLVSALHRWGSGDDFHNRLREGAGKINSAFDFMQNRMIAMRDVEIRYPEDLLKHVLKNAGAGQAYLLKQALEYLDGEGDDTMHGVVQAAAYATQALSRGRGRRPGQWDARANVERNLWQNVGVNMYNQHANGTNLEDIYLDAETSLLERVADMIRQKAVVYEGEFKEVLTQTAQEVLGVE